MTKEYRVYFSEERIFEVFVKAKNKEEALSFAVNDENLEPLDTAINEQSIEIIEE